jgi:cobalt-zinc-cadmium efflux system membrane fusion protein
VSLTRTIEQRLHTLYEGKATSLREWQQAQVDLTAAENDFRTAETALEATRNRLRILGKTDEEISNFQKTGTISREAPVFAPLAGTIVQRKVGPGQYLTAGASDPVFVIGDLSTCGSWRMCARLRPRMSRLDRRSNSRSLPTVIKSFRPM